MKRNITSSVAEELLNSFPPSFQTVVVMEGLFVSHPSFSVEFDKEIFPLEAQLTDLCPAEGIDLCVSLITVKDVKESLYFI